MKKLRLFDSLKLVLATVACVFILNIAHADNTWKYAPLPIGYAVDSDLVELTESNESFNTYTVKETKNTAKRMLYITNANPLPANHKYFMRVRFNSNLANLPYFRYMLDGTYTNLGYGAGYNTSCRKNEWCNVTQIITPQQELNLNGVSDGLLAANNSYTAGETITIDKNGFLTVFDLTEIFGAGNEPATVADAERALSIDTTIKIATTRYNEEQFEPVKTDLSAAVNAVEYVVSNTMTQAQQIDQIANEKQTRPDEGCMAKYCLLVEDEDGTPHWYPIAGANGVEYNLPSGYTQLEYIGASSGQFINTGINPTDQMIIKTDILFVSDDISVFGGSQNNTNKMQVYKYLNKILVRFHNQTSSTLQPVISNNNWYSLKIDYSNSYGTINDTTTSIIKTDAEQITYPIYIWANNIAGTISGGTGGSYIKFFEIRNSDGTNLFYGVPARRNSDNVVGMYDMVSGQFFTNAGTGTFVASPDM